MLFTKTQQWLHPNVSLFGTPQDAHSNDQGYEVAEKEYRDEGVHLARSSGGTPPATYVSSVCLWLFEPNRTITIVPIQDGGTANLPFARLHLVPGQHNPS